MIVYKENDESMESTRNSKRRKTDTKRFMDGSHSAEPKAPSKRFPKRVCDQAKIHSTSEEDNMKKSRLDNQIPNAQKKNGPSKGFASAINEAGKGPVKDKTARLSVPVPVPMKKQKAPELGNAAVKEGNISGKGAGGSVSAAVPFPKSRCTSVNKPRSPTRTKPL